MSLSPLPAIERGARSPERSVDPQGAAGGADFAALFDAARQQTQPQPQRPERPRHAEPSRGPEAGLKEAARATMPPTPREAPREAPAAASGQAAEAPPPRAAREGEADAPPSDELDGARPVEGKPLRPSRKALQLVADALPATGTATPLGAPAQGQSTERLPGVAEPGEAAASDDSGESTDIGDLSASAQTTTASAVAEAAVPLPGAPSADSPGTAPLSALPGPATPARAALTATAESAASARITSSAAGAVLKQAASATSADAQAAGAPSELPPAVRRTAVEPAVAAGEPGTVPAAPPAAALPAATSAPSGIAATAPSSQPQEPAVQRPGPSPELLPTAAPTASAPAASTAASATTTATTPSASLLSHLQQAGFGDELGAQVAIWARQGVQQAELRLNPAEMGPVQVRIQLDGQQTQVVFVAEQGPTRDALQAALGQLARALEREGLQWAGGGVQAQLQQQQQQDARQQDARQPAEPGGSRSGGSSLPALAAQPGLAGGVKARGLLDLYA